MNQGPSPGLPVVKDKLEMYITQMTVGTQTGRSWGRGCGQGQRSLRPQAGSRVAATAPSPSPIQKQSASRLSSTAPMNQGPSPSLLVVKDKLETYITQMTVGTQTGR